MSGLLNLEDFTEAAPAVVEQSGVTDYLDNGENDQLAMVADDIAYEQDCCVIDNGCVAIDALNDVTVVLDESIQEGGLSEVTVAVMSPAVEALLVILGNKGPKKRQVFPAMEGFTKAKTRISTTKTLKASLEGVIRDVWEAIKRFVKSAIDTLTDWYKHFTDNVYRLGKRVESTQRVFKLLKQTKGHDKPNPELFKQDDFKRFRRLLLVKGEVPTTDFPKIFQHATIVPLDTTTRVVLYMNSVVRIADTKLQMWTQRAVAGDNAKIAMGDDHLDDVAPDDLVQAFGHRYLPPEFKTVPASVMKPADGMEIYSAEIGLGNRAVFAQMPDQNLKNDSKGMTDFAKVISQIKVWQGPVVGANVDALNEQANGQKVVPLSMGDIEAVLNQCKFNVSKLEEIKSDMSAMNSMQASVAKITTSNVGPIKQASIFYRSMVRQFFRMSSDGIFRMKSDCVQVNKAALAYAQLSMQCYR